MSNSTNDGNIDRFRGVYALLLTPFLHNKEIDWNGYDRYVDWQLSKRPHGLFAVCGSSEMNLLTMQERLDLAKRAVARAGNTPVLATGNVQSDPGEHADEVRRMAETGVSGIVLVTSGRIGEDQNRLEQYFAELIAHSPLPVFLYEWPGAPARFVAAETYGRLVKYHGVVGIKDTTCTPEGIRAKITNGPGSLVFQANIPFLRESVRDGAQGIMATTSAAAVDAALAYWQAEKNGETEAAQTFHELLVFLSDSYGKGYPAAAKYLASLRGVPMEAVTRKSVSMNDSDRKGIATWLNAAQRLLEP